MSNPRDIGYYSTPKVFLSPGFDNLFQCICLEKQFCSKNWTARIHHRKKEKTKVFDFNDNRQNRLFMGSIKHFWSTTSIPFAFDYKFGQKCQLNCFDLQKILRI